MLKTLTLRCIAAYAALDLVFNPLVIIAFTQLLGIAPEQDALVVFSALIAVKIACWAAFLSYQLKPWERFARASAASKSTALLVQADRSLQAFPTRFGAVYTLSWVGTYALGFLIVKSFGPERAPIAAQAANAVALLCVALVFGSFAFGFPLGTMLTADSAAECSALAGTRGVELDRSAGSLQVRIGVVALALGLGPLLWMVALGYMKQIESSHEQRTMRAELVASELAYGLQTLGSAVPASARLKVLLDTERSGGFALALEGNELVGSDGAKHIFDDPALRSWLLEANASAQTGVRARIDLDNIVAFRRVTPSETAVAIIRAPATASSSFVLSSGLFAIVVGIWAPVCAYILGRAVAGPIERLTATARQVVEEGNLAQIGAMPVARNDEIGVLTEKFNDVLELMRSLSAAAHAIAKGDLRVTVSGKGELPDAFRGMLKNLRTMVHQIRETSVDLASAATEIFAASQEQEAAAASQSSAMVEISRTMDSLSESAAHVSDAVQGVLGNAERTLQNTDGMVRRIGELTSHAGRIGEILEVIRDIADRSDLLALNGSLEASHAGEGGRGFALVAAEMRRLAERVTASVQDVKKLVFDIRESGSSTVMATEESRKLAEGTTDAARQITFVTQQQRSGTEQVSQSVKGIADVVSQAVSATSQTRTSAQGLKTQADRLSDLVQRFELSLENG
jgi:methyl-accepting chemotaxis protein